MTPEQQRIAIAEACNWTNGYLIATCLDSLDTMHEALGLIIDDQEAQVRYADEIIKLCGKNRIACHNASAAQRAEAFLRTLNLWKD